VTAPGAPEAAMWIALEIIARLVVGGILLAAGIAKLASPATWRQVWLAAYRLLPRPLVAPAALLLPTVEIGCGVALLTGAFGTGSFLAAAVLLTALTLAVATALLRHLDISCGCAGRLDTRVSGHAVARNLVLIVAVAVPAWHRDPAELALGALPWPAQVAVLAPAVLAVLGSYALARARQRRTFLASVSRRVAAAEGGDHA
jgi:Methylamine utilisation protein MauE